MVDDLGHPWGTDDFHFGYQATVGSTISTDSSGRRTRTLGNIVIGQSESELFRIAVMVVDDYHAVRRQPVPNGVLSYMRRIGTVGLTLYSEYDTVVAPANVLSTLPTVSARERTLFHESGHVFRHVMDGERFTHWENDLVRFRYLRCHTGFEIAERGYSFNEGWAHYWQRARWSGMTPGALINTPPSMFDRGSDVVVTDVSMPGTTTTTDYCDDGTVGGRGIPFDPRHLDWNEHMVADRLLFLASSCAGATPDAADRAMLEVLDANRGRIHSLFQFETALCAAGVCCGVPRTPLEECPPEFSNDGETCSREGHIIQKWGSPPRLMGVGSRVMRDAAPA